MSIYNYEYGTSPRKLNPKKKTKTKKDINRQLKINEQQRRNAIKLEKKKHNQNVLFIIAIFLILLAISYRSSLINEKFNELQSNKEKLSQIEKTNGQLEVSIKSSLNLSSIEEAAKEKLGMQKLDNGQKVFVNLEKKDYLEAKTQEIDLSKDVESKTWYEKIYEKIFGN